MYCFDKREERKKQDMEQRLEELKEKITSFVRDYNIQSIDVLIRKDETLPTKVNLEIRV